MSKSATGGIEPHLTPEQIDEMLNDGVAATVTYAQTHSPHYRKIFSGVPRIRNTSDLLSLPLTTKRQVSECNDRFWCVGREKFVDICTTSGTIGVPTLCPLTQADLDRLGKNELFCFNRAGLSSGDVVVLAVTIDKCFMAGLAYFEGLRRLARRGASRRRFAGDVAEHDRSAQANCDRVGSFVSQACRGLRLPARK